MPLHTIEPRRLYRQIADQLRATIERAECPPGTRLPPERELALQLGVSRPSVREALIALEVEGRVEVRMGSGVYVREPDEATHRPVSAEGPLEIIRARQLIEAELAAVAARTMNEPRIDGLRAAVNQMEQEAASGTVPTQGDRLFHTRVAEACDNSVLLRVVSDLFDERRNPLFEQLGTHFENAASWAQAIEEHRQVIAAIASRSPDAAREAMARHLTHSHDRFTANFANHSAAPATVSSNTGSMNQPLATNHSR
jgi:GntR family transcriptional regulator, transcriptional repressor for pyruvate dehydrogenase complex